MKQRAFQTLVHERQGLTALARGETIYDAFTLKVLKRKDLIRADGVATPAGRIAAAAVMRDEARWSLYRKLFPDDAASVAHHGIAPIADTLPADIIAELDRRLTPHKVEP